MLNLSNDSKIYVHIPAGWVTGGVELLHQLVHELRSIGRKAYAVYFGPRQHLIPDDYKLYDIEIADSIDDSERNIEVYAETMLRALGTNKRKTQKFWWWLSVDMFFLRSQLDELSLRDIVHWNGTLAKQMFWLRLRRSISRKRNMFSGKFILRHFSNLDCGYQCCYIRDFLIRNGFQNIMPLRDYINDEHIGSFLRSGRKNTVLYNPKKGFEFTSRLIASAPDINWVALEGMNRSTLRETMRKAKVYVDFGNHPGMDRLPRECASNGCCIITGRKGSAGYYDDVPISNDFKFDDAVVAPKDVIKRIRSILSNYESEISKQESYRKFISGQKTEFCRQVRAVFTVKDGT